MGTGIVRWANAWLISRGWRVKNLFIMSSTVHPHPVDLAELVYLLAFLPNIVVLLVTNALETSPNNSIRGLILPLPMLLGIHCHSSILYLFNEDAPNLFFLQMVSRDGQTAEDFKACLSTNPLYLPRATNNFL
jgi:hypothetical protein